MSFTASQNLNLPTQSVTAVPQVGNLRPEPAGTRQAACGSRLLSLSGRMRPAVNMATGSLKTTPAGQKVKWQKTWPPEISRLHQQVKRSSSSKHCHQKSEDYTWKSKGQVAANMAIESLRLHQQVKRSSGSKHCH